MSRKYTPEQIAFLREIAPGRYADEIVELFNARFHADLTISQLKAIKKNYKIKSGVPRRRITGDEGLFTREQKEFIAQHAKGRYNQELADLVNKKYGLSVTARQISTYKKNRGLVSGLDCRFRKGNVPANKGKKGLYNIGGNRTSFKPGHKPANYKPIGYERIDRDGYVLVKVRDDGPWNKRWRHKHRIIWEEANGPIPRGHALIFLDQNKQNVTLENLALIPQSKLSTLNRKGLLYKNAEFTKTGLIMADLYQKISQRKKK